MFRRHPSFRTPWLFICLLALMGTGFGYVTCAVDELLPPTPRETIHIARTPTAPGTAATLTPNAARPASRKGA